MSRLETAPLYVVWGKPALNNQHHGVRLDIVKQSRQDASLGLPGRDLFPVSGQAPSGSCESPLCWVGWLGCGYRSFKVLKEELPIHGVPACLSPAAYHLCEEHTHTHASHITRACSRLVYCLRAYFLLCCVYLYLGISLSGVGGRDWVGSRVMNMNRHTP